MHTNGHCAPPSRCDGQPIQRPNDHAKTCAPRSQDDIRRNVSRHASPRNQHVTQMPSRPALAMKSQDCVEGAHNNDIAESAAPQRPPNGQKALLIRAILRSEKGRRDRRRNSTGIQCRTQPGNRDLCGDDGAPPRLQPVKPVGAPAPNERNASERRNGTGTEKCRPFRFAHATPARRDNLPRTGGDNLRGHP